MRWTSAALAVSAITVFQGVAFALPREGDLAPDALAEDADGHPFSLARQRGKPALIVYEDRDSSGQNAPFKAELARLASGGRYKSAVVLAAVADVSGFDFWPVKGFVKDAIRAQSQQFGTTIYCDWKGRFRAALGLRAKTSNVILLDRTGRVRFAASGPLDPSTRRRVLELLRAEVEP